LKPEELAIYEDGVAQKLTGVRLVGGGEAAATAPRIAGEAPAPALDPLRQLHLVTLIFEPLDTEGRALARQAALELVQKSPPTERLCRGLYNLPRVEHCAAVH